MDRWHENEWDRGRWHHPRDYYAYDNTTPGLRILWDTILSFGIVPLAIVAGIIWILAKS